MSNIENYNLLKQFSKQQLLGMLDPAFYFKTDPWTQQVAALIASVANIGFLCALDLGTGKTKVAIDTVRFRDIVYGIKPSVFVICLDGAVEKWAEEISTHSEYTSLCLRGSIEERWEMMEQSHANFHIVNIEGYRLMLATKWNKIIHKPTARRVYQKGGLHIDPALIQRLIAIGHTGFCIDESHLFKNHRSLNFKIMKRIITQGVRDIQELTGTPFGNTLIDIWPQYYIADRGKTFSTSITRFRDAYFVDKGWFGPKYVPTKSGKAKIEEKLWSRAIRYEEGECQDLPPKVYRQEKYQLSKEQRELYWKLYQEIEDDDRVKDVKNRSQVWHQICSGFILHKGGYVYKFRKMKPAEKKELVSFKRGTKTLDGQKLKPLMIKSRKKGAFYFKENPKLDSMMDLILAHVENYKFVIFHEFTVEGELLEKRLKKAKVKYIAINGRTKDKYNENMKFEKQEKYRVAVVHPKSGGASIDLIAGSYCLFMANSGSVISRHQCEKRMHRGGQTKRCFFYDFIGIRTVEVGRYRDLENNMDSFSKTMDGKSFKAKLRGE